MSDKIVEAVLVMARQIPIVKLKKPCLRVLGSYLASLNPRDTVHQQVIEKLTLQVKKLLKELEKESFAGFNHCIGEFISQYCPVATDGQIIT